MNKSESLKELAPALAKAQAELKNPSLDSTNPHFKSKFASLAGVRNTITAVFSKHGLSIIQNLSSTDRAVSCSTMILHTSGEWIETDPLLLPATKLDAQGFGSAATYARRYSGQAAANVVGDDDDDGNAAKPSTSEKSDEKATTVHAPAKLALDSLSDEAQGRIGRLASSCADLIAAGNMVGAAERFNEYDFQDEAEKAAFWSFAAFKGAQGKAMADEIRRQRKAAQ